MKKKHVILVTITILMLLILGGFLIRYFINEQSDRVNTSRNRDVSVRRNNNRGTNDMEQTHVMIRYSGGEAEAVLNDNPTTQSLIAQLPVTVNFENFSNNEKIFRLPRRLSRERAPRDYYPEVGDFTSYGPWGSVAIYYGSVSNDRSRPSDIIPMGRVTSGFSRLVELPDNTEVTISRID